MQGRQSGISTPVVAIGVLVVVLVLGIGGAAVAKVGPFATSSTTGGQPAGIAKPSDPKQAVTDAVARTAAFKDVKYTVSGSFNNANQPASTTEAQVSVQASPYMSDSKLTTSAGKKLESITNGEAQVFCTHPEGSAAQRFPNQKIAADAADPFAALLKDSTNWKYLDDVDVSGHKDWQVMADRPQPTSTGSATDLKYDVNTVQLWIDSRSGKIEKRADHTTGTVSGNKFDQTVVYANFVYDAGVTIPACT